MTGRKKKGFNPKQKTGWKACDGQSKRRMNALSAHKGDYLATAKALQYLANINQDKSTKRKAKSDADYFFKQYERQKGMARNGRR